MGVRGFWLGGAIAEGNIAYLALTLVSLLAPFALAYVILSKTFIKTATSSYAAARKEYKEKAYAAGKASSALFKKEAGRFFASSGYMLNAGFGAVMEVAAAVIALIKMPVLAQYLAMAGVPDAYLFPLLTGALCLMAAMTDISAPSVSLEGKALWIVRAAPVAPADALRAKLRFHWAVSGTATLIASVLVCVAVRATPFQWALGVVLPQLFVLFEGLLGLLANLKYPNLDWENENQAIKTGMAVFIAMFGAMGAALIVVGVWYGLSTALPPDAALLGDIVLLGAADALMYRRLVTKGAERFAEL